MLRLPAAGVEICAAITIFLVVTPISVVIPVFVGAIAVGHTVVLVAAFINAPGVVRRAVAVTASLRGVLVDVLVDTSGKLPSFLGWGWGVVDFGDLV